MNSDEVCSGDHTVGDFGGGGVLGGGAKVVDVDAAGADRGGPPVRP